MSILPSKRCQDLSYAIAATCARASQSHHNGLRFFSRTVHIIVYNTKIVKLLARHDLVVCFCKPPRDFFVGVLPAAAQPPFHFFARGWQYKDRHRFRQLLLHLLGTLYVDLQHQILAAAARFLQPFFRRAVGIFAEHLRIFQKITTLDHGVEFRLGDEIITFSTGFGRPAHPGSTRHRRHGSRQLQNFLHQRAFAGPRWPGDNQDQRRDSSLVAHSMFWTCSRNFSISALISRAKPVMVSASLSTPGVFDSMVLASRCISCNRKSSFFPSSPAPSSNFVNCWRWLRRRSNSSLISLRSASRAASWASREGSMMLPFSNSFSRASSLRENAGRRRLTNSRTCSASSPIFVTRARNSSVKCRPSLRRISSIFPSASRRYASSTLPNSSWASSVSGSAVANPVITPGNRSSATVSSSAFPPACLRNSSAAFTYAFSSSRLTCTGAASLGSMLTC